MSDQEPDVIDTIRGLLKRQRPWAAADLALACIQQMRNEAEEVAKEALGIMKADEQRIAELEKDRDGLGEELGEIRRLAGTAIHPPDETAAGLKSRITGLEERAEKAERGIRDALVELDPGDEDDLALALQVRMHATSERIADLEKVLRESLDVFGVPSLRAFWPDRVREVLGEGRC